MIDYHLRLPDSALDREDDDHQPAFYDLKRRHHLPLDKEDLEECSTYGWENTRSLLFFVDWLGSTGVSFTTTCFA